MGKKKLNTGALLTFVAITTLLPLALAMFIVLSAAVCITDLNSVLYSLDYIGAQFWLPLFWVFRFHYRYKFMKDLTIETTDGFNDVLRKYYSKKYKDRYGK